MKKAIALLLALALALSLAACGSSGSTGSAAAPAASAPAADTSAPAQEAESAAPAAESPEDTAPAEAPAASGDKVLTIGITTDITPLNSVNPSQGDVAAHINNILYPTLVGDTLNADGTVDPVWQLGTAVTTEDNKTFTVTIRDDVYWTDGEPVTAEDVVFAIDLFTDPTVVTTTMGTFISSLAGSVSPTSGYREEGTAPSAAVVDEYSFTLTTEEEKSVDFVTTRLLYNLYALPKHLLGDIPREELLGNDLVNESKVVYGAFYLDSVVTGSELVLKANPDYWKGAPKLDYIKVVFLTSAQITSQLASGEIDMAWPAVIDNADYDYIISQDNVVTDFGSPVSITAMFINNERISDPKVRTAMALAIDNQDILDHVLGGYGEVSNLPLSSTSKYYNADLAQPTYDPDAAKALLAETDFDLSAPIVISITSGRQTIKNVALLVESYLETVGFNIEIKEVDNAVVDCIRGDYDLTFITQTEQPMTPSHTLGIIVQNGWTRYVNPEVDPLFEALTGPSTPEEVSEAMRNLETITITDYPVVSIYNSIALLAKNVRVTTGGPASFGMLTDIELWDVAD